MLMQNQLYHSLRYAKRCLYLSVRHMRIFFTRAVHRIVVIGNDNRFWTILITFITDGCTNTTNSTHQLYTVFFDGVSLPKIERSDSMHCYWVFLKIMEKSSNANHYGWFLFLQDLVSFIRSLSPSTLSVSKLPLASQWQTSIFTNTVMPDLGNPIYRSFVTTWKTMLILWNYIWFLLLYLEYLFCNVLRL